MEVYLLRHGIAEAGRPGHADSERALTAEGKKKLREVLGVARGAGLEPSMILTSPYKRAVQTAELAAEVLGYRGDLLRTEALVPESRPEAAWDELKIHKDEPRILLAGHEPLFSTLAAFLLGSGTLRVDFKKGALVRIDFDRFGATPAGVLKWMLTPKLAGSG